ncbi:hypothetical protein [Snodgrassella communis]|uniref:hypothetical protein n=1 Tax=Snodgrassella communis TaxID=2946699 RepID=UPI00286BDF80|nr:hypothetical protein [Snodgrassella communis]WMY92175.1 hypothetical protein PYG29_02030 [Snodgrassella communis]
MASQFSDISSHTQPMIAMTPPPAKSQKFATPEQPQPAVADPNIACIILKLP